jgi:hypothetical protein
MTFEVRCYAAPYENTSTRSENRATDLAYHLSLDHGLVEVIMWMGAHQRVVSSYTYGA